MESSWPWSSSPGVDTVALSQRLDAVMKQMQAAAPPENVEVFPALYRQADFIQRGIDNVEEAVLLGALLVVLVVFLFQLNVRSTVITLTALPLSVAVTAMVFDLVRPLREHDDARWSCRRGGGTRRRRHRRCGERLSTPAGERSLRA